MIAEFGHFALVLAMLVAIVQGVVPLIGAHRGDNRWMGLAGPTSMAQLICVGVSFAALTHAYVTSDFSVLNVVQNSHSDKPMLYKVSGVWGNHEGSMLLWVLILAIFGTAVTMFGKNLPPALRARVLGIQGLISIGFYLFILLTSNPFERIDPPPIDGQSLNPLLQDPGLAFHPPFLYLGYVGYSMAFSFAIAALIEGRVDPAWARWVRPWALAAWGFLTVGIALGSWWAYYELGWGGWWFWDPVENASFMPWLAGTALIHSAIVAEKRDALKSWTIFLAIVAFSLSLLGTFLVRSGVLTSVHAFATDPSRGVFILILLCIVVGGSFALFAWRGPSLRGKGLFKPVSREGGLLLNNLLLTTATAAVLLGTLYPLFIDALELGKVSVGPPFFNSVFIPIMLPLLVAMAIGPFLSWKRSDLGGALSRLKFAFGIAIGVFALTWWAYADGQILAYIGMGVAAWLFFGTLAELASRAHLFRAPLGESIGRMIRMPRASWGMTIAHLGLAIAVAGMTGAAAWKVESIQVMKPGETVNVGGYDYTFEGARNVMGHNYAALRGTFKVTRDGKTITTLHPEKRKYFVRTMDTTEAGIHSLFTGDLYAVIGDATEDGEGFVTRIYFNPLVAWIWAGSALLTLGALISLTDRRHRVGAPSRRRREEKANATA
ncbi:MAG: heme lyase CcmF/NrfE family subunit [Rhodospirillales bacterium]|nr:heme lyase CcmF/NrfE family subunit [Rhodospirillales bacterium]